MASVGNQVRVMPLRVLGKCGGYDSDILDAMRWAAGIPVAGVPASTVKAQVINLSLGSDGPCTQAYVEAIAHVKAQGVTVVAAAGNDGVAVGTPANCAGAIAVGGVRQTGTK